MTALARPDHGRRADTISRHGQPVSSGDAAAARPAGCRPAADRELWLRRGADRRRSATLADPSAALSGSRAIWFPLDKGASLLVRLRTRSIAGDHQHFRRDGRFSTACLGRPPAGGRGLIVRRSRYRILPPSGHREGRDLLVHQRRGKRARSLPIRTGQRNGTNSAMLNLSSLFEIAGRPIKPAEHVAED